MTSLRRAGTLTEVAISHPAGRVPVWRIARWIDWLAPGLLVVAAVVLVAVVGWQARNAEGEHRRATEQMRVTVAELAASTLGARMRAALHGAGDAALVASSRDGTTAMELQLRAVLVRADSMHACRCTGMPRPLAAFAISPRGKVVVSATKPEANPLIDAFFRKASARPGSGGGITTGSEQGEPWMVLAIADPDGGPRFLGLLVSVRSLQDDLLPRLLAYPTPLLPLSLVGQRPADSVASFTILTSDGQLLAATRAPDAASHGRAMIAATDSAFLVEAQLSPFMSEAVARTLRTSSLLDVRVISGLVVVLLLALLALAWRAAASARFRHQFAVSAAHELRTPLTQVLMYGEMLALDRVRSPSDRTLAHTVIVREARRMMDAVDDIMLQTRAERSRRDLVIAPRPLNPQVTEVVNDLAPLAGSHGVALTAALQGAPLVAVDRRALTRVLTNLIENGIKYGGGTVRVSTVVHHECVDLSVDDEGPGVPAAERQAIWEPFARLGNAADSPGAGIGLAIVSELVRAMRGTVHVEDTPTGGARFRVRLPVVMEGPA